MTELRPTGEPQALPAEPAVSLSTRRQWPFAVQVLIRLFHEKPLAFWGGLVPIVLISLVAIFADLLTDLGPNQQDVRAALEGPSGAHWFGTDQFGRDVYSRIVHGSRLSLMTGVVPVFIAVSIATVVGTVSGYFGGLVDLLIQRVVDVLMAFPTFVLLLLLAAVLNPSKESTIISIAIILIAGPSRVIRGQVLAVKAQPYVEAARVVGAGPVRVMIRHVFPNTFDVMVVAISINVGAAILIAASLSFLGLGVPPPSVDWGQLVSANQLAYLSSQPWIIVTAGFALSITVFAFNMLGDGLRDVLDPRLRGL